ALEAEQDVRDRMASIEAEAYAMAKENGMTVYELSDDEIAAWKAAAQPVYDQFAADDGDLGQ
ncbi:MAG: C4-dicarboxylate ABC transporter substrate-binding protein, partial [Alphaproteobacteria bacterium]|nr:C4-dicarboxylate ABC transporter substrate-binding protein [Alphaproteobacteria bacterium]